jgi:hypothetical protein
VPIIRPLEGDVNIVKRGTRTRCGRIKTANVLQNRGW